MREPEVSGLLIHGPATVRCAACGAAPPPEATLSATPTARGFLRCSCGSRKWYVDKHNPAPYVVRPVAS